jgi:hypothetical protein
VSNAKVGGSETDANIKGVYGGKWRSSIEGDKFGNTLESYNGMGNIVVRDKINPRDTWIQ